MAGEFIQEQIHCAKHILRGECQGEFYHTFAGDAPLCTCKRAGIAYDPKSVFEKIKINRLFLNSLFAPRFTKQIWI